MEKPRLRPVCAWKSRRYHSSSECVLLRPTNSFLTEHHLAAETISDVILVISPLWILRDVRMSSGLRIRLIAIFSCSLMTTMVGLAHVVLILKMPGALEAIMGEYPLLSLRHTLFRKP